jgi:cell division protein FtsW (lipid II flippase)
MKQPGAISLWIARSLLDPSDTARMIVPTVADARHEWHSALAMGDAARAARVKRALAWDIARVMSAALVLRAFDRGRRATWSALAPAIAAALAGVMGLRSLVDGPGLAVRQLGFAAIGVLLGALAILMPARPLRLLATAAAPILVAALAVVVAFGTPYEGVTRWMTLGPLRLHVGIAMLPLFALANAKLGCTARPRKVAAFMTVSLALLQLEPDLATTIVYVVVAVVGQCGRARLMSGVLGSLAVLVAIVREPALTPVPYVEDAVRSVGRTAPHWLALGIAAMVLLLIATSRRVLDALRHGASRRSADASSRAGLGRSFPQAIVITSGTALVTLPFAVGATDGSLPFLSYGGSAAMAAMVLAGLAFREPASPSSHEGLASPPRAS